MMIAKRILWAMLLLAGLAVAAFVGLYPSSVSGPNKANFQARAFCERLVPMLDAYRGEHGQYPVTIPEVWLAGQAVPPLIDRQSFYMNTGDGYWFRFRDPSWFYDDIWGCGSPSQHSPGWLNYDGY